jgi:hypothetical protein
MRQLPVRAHRRAACGAAALAIAIYVRIEDQVGEHQQISVRDGVVQQPSHTQLPAFGKRLQLCDTLFPALPKHFTFEAKMSLSGVECAASFVPVSLTPTGIKGAGAHHKTERSSKPKPQFLAQ